jgi:hypothetical protein
MADHGGLLQFASRPQDTSVVHFGGPLHMGLQPLQKLVRGRESELRAGVGTPGLGAGTFAMLEFEGRIPKNVHPKAEIEFPPAGPGKAPERLTVTLSKRC